MGLMSKIFKTDKLEYILREEEEFSVAAPENWNVTELKVGDKITPDMWIDEEFYYYGNKLQSQTVEITEIGEDDEGPYVMLAGKFPGYINDKHTVYDLEIVNEMLKPEYKIFLPGDVNESEDDEFNVDAPEEWNQKELKVGDVIDHTKVQKPSTWKEAGDVKWIILDIGSELVKFKNKGHIFSFPIDFTNSDILNQHYIIEPNLNESEEDEFNVDAPKEWNPHELKAGDYFNERTGGFYTSKEDIPQEDKLYTYEIMYIGPNEGEYYKPAYYNYNIIAFRHAYNPINTYVFTVEHFNNTRGPVLNAYINLPDRFDNLLEIDSDGEFNVDAPQSWNITELGIGNYVAPEMIDVPKDKRRWNHFHKLFGDPKRAPGWEIVKFISNEYGNYVELEYRGYLNDFKIDLINKYLKPDFKIVDNSNNLSSLLETDDEFAVDAPEDWNENHWEDYHGTNDEAWDSLFQFVETELKKRGVKKRLIDKYLDDEITNVAITSYYDISGSELYKDFEDFKDTYDLYELDDEFNVDAPENWNVEELTAGDIITPDMWDQSKMEGKLNSFLQKPTKIEWVGYSDWDEDEEELLVGLEGDEYFIENDIDFINSLLKPEYKIVKDSLNELSSLLETDDEFNVDAPENWNVEYLTVGDIVTPDMWDDEVRQLANVLQFKKVVSQPHEIALVFPQSLSTGKSGWTMKFTDGTFIHSSFLKPEYGIEPPLGQSLNELLEVDDEFNVDAPQNWNIEELTDGDTITPDMWNKDSKLIWELLDIDINKPYKIITIFEDWEGYEGQDGFDPFFIEFEDENYHRIGELLAVVNGALKPEYKVVNSDQILESDDDDFNITDVPKGWNVEELTVGDIITNDMWDLNTTKGKYFFDVVAPNESAFKIYGIQNDGVGDDRFYVTIMGVDSGIDFNDWLDKFNDYLKPEFKVFKPLNESTDDEFNVDAPQEWNVTELGKGDYIEPYMWEEGVEEIFADLEKGKLFKKITTKPVKIENVYKEGNYFTFLNSDSPYFTIKGIDHYFMNDVLKPQFKIVDKNIFESEDEFNIQDIPKGWNIEELTVGDVITPDMWEEDSDFYDLIDDPNEDWHIEEIDKDYVELTTETGGQVISNIDDINEYLKPDFKIVKSLNESEDDFNIDAPQDWNIEELTVGDIITPDMWNLDHIVFWDKQTEEDFRELIKKPVKIIFVSEGDELYFGVEGLEKKLTYPFAVTNNDLKPEYRVFKPLDESVDDEFNVDAPQDWNVEELTVGDTITSDMWDPNKIGYSIVKMKSTKIEWIGYSQWDEDEEELLVGLEYGNKTIENDIDFVNSLLKPEYKIVQSLSESVDDEFNVDAPQDWWDIELTVNDTVTPDMWDRSKDLDNLAYLQYDQPLVISKVAGNKIKFKGGVWYLLSSVNNLLKPWYRIVQSLSESENEFTVDAPEEWNTIELIIGDIITPDMWDDEIKQMPSIHQFKKVLNAPHVIDNIYPQDIGGTKGYLIKFNDGTYIHSSFLNPKYEIKGSLNENEDEDFNVDSSDEWNTIELKVGDIITRDMLDPKGEDYYFFKDNLWKIQGIYDDNGWTVHLKPADGSSFQHIEFLINYLNNSVLNSKYKIYPPNDLLESEDDFTVTAPESWNVIELGIGDKITKDMIKSPTFLEAMKEDYRRDFPGVITKIYLSGPLDDKWWSVRIKFQDIGWRKHLPQSEDIKLGLGFDLDNFNKNTLKPQYQIKKPIFELNTLLETDDEYNVDAPDEWNVELLTVGDTITPDMWGDEQIVLDTSKPVIIEDIGEDDGGWWIQLGRNDAPFDLNDVNDCLKSKYKVVPYILQESEDEFNVEAPKKWNISYLNVDDIITPNMWNKREIKQSTFDIPFDKSLKISWIGGDRINNFIEFNKSEVLYNIEDIHDLLKPQYRINLFNLHESDNEFNVDAPEEWNYEHWEPTKDMSDEEIFESFDKFVTSVLKKYRVEEKFIETYLDEIFSYGDINAYEGISDKDLYDDFLEFKNNTIGTDEFDDELYEEEDFNVTASEDWWPYDGDLEILYRDTYWYEDEDGREATIEREGGGIININDLEQYAYDRWKPFTGDPSPGRLQRWWADIDWDYDLVEIFDNYDDSLFDADEDFDWSTADNVDMERSEVIIRAISPLKENDDEFTVKAPKKWDVVYLTKGDFLDNTNSTLNDPNVKYEIGNITSDGEIEIKKYINRGNGFYPQFDRFMKTRKGIVKAKLKDGFDIESFSK